MMKKIVCAAIVYETEPGKKVVCPAYRHMEGYAMIKALGLDENHIIDEGFMDNEGEFQSRTEAYAIAKSSGQIDDSAVYPILVSEMIY